MNISSERYGKYIKLLLYFVVIVLINVAGLTLFLRGDLTKNKAYSLSKVSKNVAATLSEPLTIEVFFTKDLPAPHNNTEQYLRDMLNEYSLNSNKNFNFRFYNVSAETDGINSTDTGGNRQRAQDYGINPVQIQLVEEDEVKFKKAFMGLVLIHGDIVERIPTITSTEGLEYKLTTAIQKLNNKVSALLKLEDKVQVKLVLSSTLNTVAPYMGLEQLKDYPGQIKKIIDDLNPKTYNKLEFSHIDPTTNPDQAKAIEKLDIMELNWPAIKKANVSPGKGRIGLIVQHKDNVRVIPLMQVMRLPIFGTQYKLSEVAEVAEQINVNLERLVNINTDLGYLADHGTLPIAEIGPMAPQNQDGAGRFNNLISKTYTPKPINLKDKRIPDGLKCLVIARPTEKFSDYALYQIDQALMRGTNIAIFADTFKEASQPGQQPFMANQMPTLVPMDTGLEKLLAHYGVRIKKSLVLDEKCFRQRQQPQQGGGEQPIYFAPIIQNENINKELDFIKDIKSFIAVKISPLELDQKRIEAQNISAHQLFASSKRSWEMRDRITLNPMFIQPPGTDKDMASLPLAYLLEGKFNSYFKDKPMPEKPAEKKESEGNIKGEKKKSPETTKTDLSQITEKGAFREESPDAKIFVVASGEIIKDLLLDEEGSSTNSMFILNTIDALNDRDSVAAMRSKAQQFNPLDATAPATKTIIKAVNIVGLPILIIALGLIIWARRHARRKRIQLQFQV